MPGEGVLETSETTPIQSQHLLACINEFPLRPSKSNSLNRVVDIDKEISRSLSNGIDVLNNPSYLIGEMIDVLKTVEIYESFASTFAHLFPQAQIPLVKSILYNVWEIIPKPYRKSTINSKWIYKIKHVPNGSIGKYKARFVPRGFFQKVVADNDVTSALVPMYTSIITIMSLACCIGWILYHMDVKTTFSKWHD